MKNVLTRWLNEGYIFRWDSVSPPNDSIVRGQVGIDSGGMWLVNGVEGERLNWMAINVAHPEVRDWATTLRHEYGHVAEATASDAVAATYTPHCKDASSSWPGPPRPPDDFVAPDDECYGTSARPAARIGSGFLRGREVLPTYSSCADPSSPTAPSPPTGARGEDGTQICWNFWWREWYYIDYSGVRFWLGYTDEYLGYACWQFGSILF